MKHNHGASGRGPNAGAANLAMLKRTVKKIFSYYPVLAPITLACILFSSVVSSIPALFTQNVIQVIENGTFRATGPRRRPSSNRF